MTSTTLKCKLVFEKTACPNALVVADFVMELPVAE